jgi:hypothetical protein
VTEKLLKLLNSPYHQTNKNTPLHQLQSLLLQGKKQEACELALSFELWSHALILSSSMDPLTYGNVVSMFIEKEISGMNITPNFIQQQDLADDLLPLKVIYSLFAGKGPLASIFF